MPKPLYEHIVMALMERDARCFWPQLRYMSEYDDEPSQNDLDYTDKLRAKSKQIQSLTKYYRSLLNQ